MSNNVIFYYLQHKTKLTNPSIWFKVNNFGHTDTLFTSTHIASISLWMFLTAILILIFTSCSKMQFIDYITKKYSMHQFWQCSWVHSFDILSINAVPNWYGVTLPTLFWNSNHYLINGIKVKSLSKIIIQYNGGKVFVINML